MVVEFFARLGILNSLLLININVNLDPKANIIDQIKRQSKTIFIRLFKLAFPEIKLLSPVSAIEAPVKTPNNRTRIII